MSFLHNLQSDLVNEKPIGPILMKLRLLAAKLGSDELEAWVKHESEGYPNNMDLPDYRILGMSFIGQFSGAFGSGIKNAPIPPILIRKIAGEAWKYHHLRFSAAAIDSIVSDGDGDGVNLDLANLALLIKDKVYENMACNQLSGYISRSAIVEVSNAIRNRLLELTIELEKQMPGVSELELSKFESEPEIASQVFQQTVYGGLTQIHNSGSDQSIAIQIEMENYDSLLVQLAKAGLADEEADGLAKLISSEQPDVLDTDSPLGTKTRAWLGERITKGVDSGIKGGAAALVKIAQEAAKQYWGI